MSKTSQLSSKKRLKEFALLDKQKSQNQGQKGFGGKSGAAGGVRVKTAPITQRKTGV